MSLRNGGRPKNLLKYKMTNIFVPLLTMSHPKVIRPKTRRPAGENYVHIYKFNKSSTFSMSPLLTMSHPKVIRPKTRRSAGENYVHIYKFNKLSTFCISPLLTLSHPKVIRPKTRRPAGKTKYIFTNLINRRILHVTPSDHVPPEGDPSEDAPVSRENYVHIYKFNKSSTFCMSTSFRLTIRVLLELSEELSQAREYFHCSSCIFASHLRR